MFVAEILSINRIKVCYCRGNIEKSNRQSNNFLKSRES